MSRERKLRAWDPEKKKMLYTGDFKIFNEIDNGIHSGYQDDGRDWVQLELMDYTGLKDKNGVEIYERDVVKRETGCNKDFHGSFALYEIIFNNGGFLFSYLKSETGNKLPRGYTASFMTDSEGIDNKLALWSNQPLQDFEIEIIGNIHEHPELLEQGE